MQFDNLTKPYCEFCLIPNNCAAILTTMTIFFTNYFRLFKAIYFLLTFHILLFLCRKRSRSWAPLTQLRTCRLTWWVARHYQRTSEKRSSSSKICWTRSWCWTPPSGSPSTRHYSILSSRRGYDQQRTSETHDGFVSADMTQKTKDICIFYCHAILFLFLICSNYQSRTHSRFTLF